MKAPLKTDAYLAADGSFWLTLDEALHRNAELVFDKLYNNKSTRQLIIENVRPPNPGQFNNMLVKPAALRAWLEANMDAVLLYYHNTNLHYDSAIGNEQRLEREAQAEEGLNP